MNTKVFIFSNIYIYFVNRMILRFFFQNQINSGRRRNIKNRQSKTYIYLTSASIPTLTSFGDAQTSLSNVHQIHYKTTLVAECPELNEILERFPENCLQMKRNNT